MKNYNFLFIILLGIILSNCGGSKKGENTLFTFDNSTYKAKYLPQDVVQLGVLNSNSKEIDSIVFFANDKKVGSTKGFSKLSFPLKDRKLGYQNLKATVYFGGDNSDATARIELVSDIQPKLLKVQQV